MTEKLGVNEKEPAFGQKTPTTHLNHMKSARHFVLYNGCCLYSRHSTHIVIEGHKLDQVEQFVFVVYRPM